MRDAFDASCLLRFDHLSTDGLAAFRHHDAIYDDGFRQGRRKGVARLITVGR